MPKSTQAALEKHFAKARKSALLEALDTIAQLRQEIDTWRETLLKAEVELSHKRDQVDDYRAKIESQNESIASLKSLLDQQLAVNTRQNEDLQDVKLTIAAYQIQEKESRGPQYVYRLTFRLWEEKPFAVGQDHPDVMPSTFANYSPQTVLAKSGLAAAERLRADYTMPLEILNCEFICALNVK